MAENDPHDVAAAVAALLEYWLASSAIRQDKGARSIVFEMLVPGPSIAFSFVPSTEGPLIREGAIANPAAKLSTHPQALLRLLAEPGYSPRADMFPFRIDGDPTALETLAHALSTQRGAGGVIDVRAGRNQ
jgi:hypothetical protein